MEIVKLWWYTLHSPTTTSFIINKYKIVKICRIYCRVKVVSDKCIVSGNRGVEHSSAGQTCQTSRHQISNTDRGTGYQDIGPDDSTLFYLLQLICLWVFLFDYRFFVYDSELTVGQVWFKKCTPDMWQLDYRNNLCPTLSKPGLLQ